MSGVPLITVLGMHRSGTSLCANVLHAMGVNMADTPGASPENARGHWERARINDLNDQVFAIFGRGWANNAHVMAMPERWQNDPRVAAVREALVALLRPLVGGAPVGFKDPRTARLMALWRGVFADLDVQPRFVFCVRDPAQVARSLASRDRMAAAQSEYRWLIYNAEAVCGVGHDTVCIVPYEHWFDRPEETAARLAEFAGQAVPPADLVRSLIDPSLRHDNNVAAPAGPLARRLHGDIVACATTARFNDALLSRCADFEAFAQQVQPLLVETEILRASVAQQNRVLADLTTALKQARRVAV